MSTIAMTLNTFLHDLFTAVWIGGLIIIGITVMPAARQALGKGPQMKKLMDTIQKRHSVYVYVSIAGLLVTGVIQAKQAAAFQGLFRVGNAYSAALTFKHILVLIMIAIALYRSLVLGSKGKQSTPAREKLSVRLLFLNIILGIAVLLASGFTAALSAGSPLV
ncbi:MAG: CopD family protein [Anaerolineales bacterium]|nr:CopD family protein [Anaerolineales bacterium]